jgi:aspartate aminotransferase-like enzyme
LKQVFQTQEDVFILTASGTGAMEAAVVNTLSPGDKVLAVSIGVFGERFARIAQAYGAQVQTLSFPWGTAADPDQVRQALREAPEIKAVLIAHNETSTGVTNDLQAIARIVKEEFDRLLLVDAISSLGSLPLPVDEWQCDVVITGSQKGWMVPPGLAMASVSQRAWQAYSEATMPRFYFDFGAAKRYLDRGETPWTPAVSIFYGLDLALEKLFQEGMEQVYQRHARIAQRTREGAKALGLSLFADERVASNTVTAIQVPEGVDGRQLTALLREEYDVVIAGGQQTLEGKIFRIGHLGYVTEQDIDEALEALSKALPRLGFQVAGTGVNR